MEQPSLRKNYIYRLLYEVLIVITPLITTPYIARVLEPDGVGTYSYVLSIMTYFTLAAALGTSSYGAREIARCRDDKKASSKSFWEIELMTVCTSVVCLIGWGVLILVSTRYRVLFIALTPMLFATMFDISWFYTGHEKIAYSIIWNAICKVLGVCLLFLLVKEKNDLVKYIIINSCTLLLGNISMWVFLPRLLISVDFHKLSIKRHFRETLVYFIPAVATTVYTVLDKTLINLITKDVFQNGYYEEATKVINLVKTLAFTSVNTVMGARLSYLFSKNAYDEIRIRVARSMDFILLMGYSSVFGIIGVSSNFVPLFFGDGYKPVILLLRIMSVLIVIIGISNCLGTQYYTPSGRRKESAKYIIIGCLINLILNLSLIPLWGAVGAVVASIIAESVIAILYLSHSKDVFCSKQLWSSSWKRIIVGALMCFFVSVIGRAPFNSLLLAVITQVIAGVAFYVVLLIVLKDSLVLELAAQLKKILFKKIKQ